MSDEEPKQQFRGTFAHAELHQLLWEGKITTTQFVLVQIIDSYVNARGEGCWASVQRLAKHIHKSTDRVNHLLADLKKKKIIKRVGEHKVKNLIYPILETKWSRVSTAENDSPSTAEFSSAENDRQSNTEEEKRERKRGRGASRTQPRTHRNPFDLCEKRDHPLFETASNLRKALKRKKPSIPVGQGSLLNWAKILQTLVNKLDDVKAEERVKSLISWLLDNINSFEKPTVVNAEQFSKCFTWLEDIKNGKGKPIKYSDKQGKDNQTRRRTNEIGPDGLSIYVDDEEYYRQKDLKEIEEGKEE